jgi:ferrochelatase
VVQNVKRALVLMNLGSPASTALNDVKDYLSEFLMDERVIDYPYIPRLILVKGIIVPFRSPKSAEAYKFIWTKDGSPLIAITKGLQHALKDELDIPVAISMRYGQPSIKEAYTAFSENYPELEEVILLPLYPHYAMSSYETAVVQAREVHRTGNYSFQITTIKPFYNDPNYINALCDSVRPYIKEDYDHILFSYHGLPERHIYKGDITGNHCLRSADCCETDSPAHKQCYRHQCFVTTKLVIQQLGIPADKHCLSFQSRLGRSEWLKPYTVERLTALARSGIKKLLVVCPAFVSDCLETLEEMGMEGKEIFLHAGGEQFTLIPCMNTQASWVSTIKTWVEDIEQGSEEMLLK